MTENVNTIVESTSSSTMEDNMKWSSNPVILWIVIGLMILGFGYGGYYLYTRPTVEKVQAEAAKQKAEYELILDDYKKSNVAYQKLVTDMDIKNKALDKEYKAARTVYLAKINTAQVQYNKLKVDYDKSKKEAKNVQKPKTSKERVDRLRALGLNPIL